jgi:hypothetical protein
LARLSVFITVHRRSGGRSSCAERLHLELPNAFRKLRDFLCRRSSVAVARIHAAFQVRIR